MGTPMADKDTAPTATQDKTEEKPVTETTVAAAAPTDAAEAPKAPVNEGSFADLTSFGSRKLVFNDIFFDSPSSTLTITVVAAVGDKLGLSVDYYDKVKGFVVNKMPSQERSKEFMPGDLLMGVNDTSFGGIDKFENLMNAIDSNRPMLRFSVRRHEEPMTRSQKAMGLSVFLMLMFAVFIKFVIGAELFDITTWFSDDVLHSPLVRPWLAPLLGAETDYEYAYRTNSMSDFLREQEATGMHAGGFSKGSKLEKSNYETGSAMPLPSIDDLKRDEQTGEEYLEMDIDEAADGADAI